MAVFNSPVLTNAGLALLTNAQVSGKAIVFTKLASGCGAYADGEQLTEMTGLKQQRQETPPSNIQEMNGNTVCVKGIFSNVTIGESYQMTEVGLFAQSDGVEVLYAISVAQTDMCDRVPAYNGIMPITVTMEFFTQVSNTSNVTIAAAVEAYAAAEDLLDEVIRAKAAEAAAQVYARSLSKETDFLGEVKESMGNAFVGDALELRWIVDKPLAPAVIPESIADDDEAVVVEPVTPSGGGRTDYTIAVKLCDDGQSLSVYNETTVRSSAEPSGSTLSQTAIELIRVSSSNTVEVNCAVSMPLKLQCGIASVTTKAGTTVTKAITFDEPFVTGVVPAISLLPASILPNKVHLSVSGVSRLGFTIQCLHDSLSQEHDIHWIAMAP